MLDGVRQGVLESKNKICHFEILIAHNTHKGVAKTSLNCSSDYISQPGKN
jgi:hypothetical protein